MTPAQAKIKAWRDDPVQFVREVFNAQPDDWQIEVLREFPTKKRIAMKAAKGPGKSTVLAWCSWNFLVTRPHPKIAATSISGDNLADGLWSEMAKWRHKSPFLLETFEWAKTRIYSKTHPETWWMSARTWARSADASQQADSLAGLHADYLLFILDEAGGIPDGVMAAAEAGLSTGIETKLLIAGNPTNLEGPLYRACTSERHLWHLVQITGDPDNPKRAKRIDIQWARDQIEKYGRDNPFVMVNVLGEFPPASVNALIGPDEVEAAMNRKPDYEAYAFSQKRFGVDVARFGDDRTVLFPRQGLIAFQPIEMRNARTQEIAARLQKEKVAFDSEMDFIDDTGGFGAGVIDSLIQAGLNPYPVHFSSKAIDSRYLNKRAEIWFEMCDWIKRGGALPKVPELQRELCAVTYSFQNGKFRIEEKDQIKERLGHSTDYGDALALTFTLPEQPGVRRDPMGKRIIFSDYGTVGHKSDYDPLAS